MDTRRLADYKAVLWRYLAKVLDARINFTHYVYIIHTVQYIRHGKRIELEDKAKVVASDWGQHFFNSLPR